MKISKAIEILEVAVQAAEEEGKPDILDAIKLGIEALKRVKIGRGQAYEHYIDSLLGEDPE